MTVMPPKPGSAEERKRFDALQRTLPDIYRSIFADDNEPRSIVVLPSLSLDQEVLSRVAGAHHYEERMLCMLMLLRLPHAKVVYLSSTPISDAIIDYYLHLLSGVPERHARRRLTLLSCHDASPRSLTEKILERPRLMARLREAVGDPARTHITCFNVSDLERSFAVALGSPIYGADPAFLPLATKSGGRRLMREAGVEVPDGIEDLGDMPAIAEALDALKARNPRMKRAVVKLNDGFSGEGNAVFRYAEAPSRPNSSPINRLRKLHFEAPDMTFDTFSEKVGQMGAVVECFIEGEEKRSPSAQYRITPTGELQIVSTHDQILSGATGQVFSGCSFPADAEYRRAVAKAGMPAAEALREKGVIGRFGIDFVSVRTRNRWRHYAIEINLRKGGTTHPFMMLQFLTGGSFNEQTGLLNATDGGPLFYVATDNLVSPDFQGLTPDDLMDIAVEERFHFNRATQEGVAFHLIGALSQFGKLGAVCVGRSPERAQKLYSDVERALSRASGKGRR